MKIPAIKPIYEAAAVVVFIIAATLGATPVMAAIAIVMIISNE